MRKRFEMIVANSCLNRANPDELIFVFLGRDQAAPAAIRAWIAERLRLGLNQPGDPKLASADECARIMEVERTAWSNLGQGQDQAPRQDTL